MKGHNERVVVVVSYIMTRERAIWRAYLSAHASVFLNDCLFLLTRDDILPKLPDYKLAQVQAPVMDPALQV